MTRYWWVNHKQTCRQEIEGGYLWSPKVESNGARSHFYDNMRRAVPGDFVLSMADARIAHIGIVTDYAVSAPKPEEFGHAGAYWLHEGWLLPVAWQQLPQHVRPKERIAELAPLLRSRYAPIQANSGNGNQKAYFCEIDDNLFRAILEVADLQDLTALSKPLMGNFPGYICNLLEEAVSAKIERDQSLSATEKIQLRKARVGQGVFRANVFSIEQRCRVTGIDNPGLLVASHIKPWRSCENSKQRLDGCNGLLLAPHVDFLFDRGLISFRNSGAVIVSPRVSLSEIEKFGLAEHLNSCHGDFVEAQMEYLNYHRTNVLLG